MGEWMYRSAFLDLGTNEVSGYLHDLDALPPRKEIPVTIGWKVWWTPEPIQTICRSENSLSYRDSNFDPSVMQPVRSRYTDYATAVHIDVCERITLGWALEK
jgi:hypothetical protein